MKFRVILVVLLALTCAQATLTASQSYSFGAVNNVTFDPGGTPLPTNYSAGVWTEDYTGGSGTGEQIVCVAGIATTANVCGNPGPGNAVSISIPSAPANTAILPSGTTNYLIDDGDPAYGAPVSTNMTGLTAGVAYTVTYFQATSEENGNNKAYNDNWNIYVIPGANAGVYICPVCATVVNPPTGTGVQAFKSPVINNTGAVSTPWEQESFTFVATAATETLEFVTDAVAVTAGTFEPPLLALAAVSSQQAAPEPGTWVLTVLGVGFVFAGAKLRRRTSPAYKRVQRG